jgi:hypothetical protein
VGRIFSSASEFFSRSGRNFFKDVGNTDYSLNFLVRQDDQGAAGQEIRRQLACCGGRGIRIRDQL